MRIFSALFLLLFCFQTQAQNDNYINQKYWGIFVQYGLAYYELPEDQVYQPILIGAIHYLPIYKSKTAFNVGMNIMPHIGFARYNSKLNFEFGANVQFDANVRIGKNHIVSLRAGAGPHFVNVETEEQSNGFIFSDNFALSYRTKLKDMHQIGLVAGWRHMSNAGLMQPNGGIDNYMFGLEYAKFME